MRMNRVWEVEMKGNAGQAHRGLGGWVDRRSSRNGKHGHGPEEAWERACGPRHGKQALGPHRVAGHVAHYGGVLSGGGVQLRGEICRGYFQAGGVLPVGRKQRTTAMRVRLSQVQSQALAGAARAPS